MLKTVSENSLLILFGYLATINLLGYFMMGLDKYKAKKNLFRIPEKTLFSIAFLGGSPGVWFGLKKFKHKTLHKTFKYGIPAIMFITYSAAVYLLMYPGVLKMK